MFKVSKFCNLENKVSDIYKLSDQNETKKI